MNARVASHVLLIEPVDFRYNVETGASNVFQVRPQAEEESSLAALALEQHRALQHLLVSHGVRVTVARGRPDTPDASFCNNWFSTHPAGADGQRVAVLYPMLAPNRRRERRPDLIELLREMYPHLLDLSPAEREGRFLESTGSLCLDDAARVAYAALSPRTDRAVTEEWARLMGYRLVAFTARDGTGVPYYHTNVMMFIGHGLAGVCLESVEDPGERAALEQSLETGGLSLLPITRAQVIQFCGNCLPLANDAGEPLLVMSSTAYHGFTAAERETIGRHAQILHADLSSFEQAGGGSARCLLGELF